MKTFLIAAAALMAAAPAAAQPPQDGPGGPAPQREITRAEAEASVKAQIDRLDFNHDGIITDKEIENALDKIATMGGPPQIGDRLHGLMKEFGKDGRLVVADLVKARMAQFDAADTNHDGKLSADERRAAMGAARANAPQ